MRESEQFDDLTTTDEDMPSPETTSMTLEDYFAGEDPEFKPILPENDGVGQLLHDNIENDLGDVGDFPSPMEADRPRMDDRENTCPHCGSEEIDYDDGAGNPKCYTIESPKKYRGELVAGEDVLFEESTKNTENTYSFYGVDSYLLPKG